MEPFAASIQQDVLRFDVRVDDAAALVQEVQPCQHLGNGAALSHQLREGPQRLPCPSSCQSGQAQRECKSGTFWALMATVGNKWFPVGVACGSRHKGFHHPTHGSGAPGASGGLKSPARKGLFGVRHSKRQCDNPQVSARLAKPGEVGGGWGYEQALQLQS